MSYDEWLLALVVWREAANQSPAAKLGVAWTIMNRAHRPRWWGTTVGGVVGKAWQYTSMTGQGDPNLVKWPAGAGELGWADSQAAAHNAYSGTVPDPTGGATHYYDDSIPAPHWANATAGSQHTCDIDRFHFWRVS